MAYPFLHIPDERETVGILRVIDEWRHAMPEALSFKDGQGMVRDAEVQVQFRYL
jgi:hypothetical protein